MPDLIEIQVTGDIVIYNDLFCNQENKEVTTCLNNGGATLLGEILQQLPTHEEGYKFKISFPSTDHHNMICHSIWSQCPKEGKASKEKAWRITQHIGCNKNPQNQSASRKSSSMIGSPDLIVIDDRDYEFRHGNNSHLWPKQFDGKGVKGIKWIILRMSAPLVQGDLWRILANKFRKRLITIVNINDLRKEEAGITQGGSWERTITDIIIELEENDMLSGLKKCRHLIVEIGSEGALWFDQGDKKKNVTVFFDPSCQEGEWLARLPGDVHGKELCMTAGITARVIKKPGLPDIAAGITSGLNAVRTLHAKGYDTSEKTCLSFPFKEIGEALTAPAGGYAAATVPARDISSGERWAIAQGEGVLQKAPLFGIARRVTLFGPRALGNIPFTRFGKLFTTDRGEIESLRGIQSLMLSYAENEKPARPLCIAVFGAPGSGKSFGIKQIAKGVLGNNVPILEFNLSQFSKPEELIGLYHQVRDKVLEGNVPVVFWDEFDANGYMWLQYLLAPMQDGKFQEGQVTHPIGKCIFVFAGGTSYTMENFAPPADDIALTKEFKLLKGPDFISRLNGYLNVLGPNPRQRYDKSSKSWKKDEKDPDLSFPVRRALLIRAVLNLPDTAECKIDRGVLTALLEIDHYNHGARSLETVINLCKREGATQIMRSHIPPAEQLSLHVNYNSFMGLVRRDLPFRSNAEFLAPYVHRLYRDMCSKNGWSVKYNIEFSKLPPEIQADNVAAAARIPEVLSHAGLRVEENPDQPLSFDNVNKIIKSQIDHLAETEHDAWMEQKLRSGWQYGPVRDDERKIHPALVSYHSLNEEDKEKDRNAVRSYPEIVKKAGYGIIKCG